MPRAPKSIAIAKDVIGQRVRAIRQKKGLTQSELATLLGTNQSHIANVERGERGVTIHQVVKLATALQVATDDILLAGRNGSKDTTPATVDRRFLRRLQRISALSRREKQALLTTIDAFLSKAS